MKVSKKFVHDSTHIIILVFVVFLLSFIMRYLRISEGFKEGASQSPRPLNLVNRMSKKIKTDNGEFVKLISGDIDKVDNQNKSSVDLYQINDYNLFILKDTNYILSDGTATKRTEKQPTIDTLNEYLLASFKPNDFSGNAITGIGKPITLYKYDDNIPLTDLSQELKFKKLVVNNKNKNKKVKWEGNFKTKLNNFKQQSTDFKTGK
jgi:hypothetical protein